MLTNKKLFWGSAASVFIVGFLLGTICIYSFSHLAMQHFGKAEHHVNTQYEIMMPYMLLYQLRGNQQETVIKILEAQLDSALYTLSYGLDSATLKIDAETQQILNRIREYRKQYPREYLSEDYKQKIEALLNKQN